MGDFFFFFFFFFFSYWYGRGGMGCKKPYLLLTLT